MDIKKTLKLACEDILKNSSYYLISCAEKNVILNIVENWKRNLLLCLW